MTTAGQGTEGTRARDVGVLGGYLLSTREPHATPPPCELLSWATDPGLQHLLGEHPLVKLDAD